MVELSKENKSDCFFENYGNDFDQYYRDPSIQRIMAKSASRYAGSFNPDEVESIKAPLAGNIFKIQVKVGDQITPGQVVIIMEAMKMETEIRASKAGQVVSLDIKEGDAVTVGQPLISFS